MTLRSGPEYYEERNMNIANGRGGSRGFFIKVRMSVMGSAAAWQGSDAVQQSESGMPLNEFLARMAALTPREKIDLIQAARRVVGGELR